MSALFLETTSLPNPLDLAEQLIEDREWLCDRPMDEELLAEFSSQWCNYRIWFTWQEELGVLIFSCGFDTKLPEHKRKAVYPLLAAVNEKMWLGHFDIDSEEGAITFRHALLLRGGQGATSEQIEDLMDIAIAECDRFFPAFQTVAWGGSDTQDALQIALMDPAGEA